MPRFPYLTDAEAGPDALVAEIRARRGGELLALDRMLLYSPALARGWNGYLGTVRTQLGVPARLRELAMCTVAIVNGAEYEYAQHAPLYVKAGASEAQAAALRDPDAAAGDEALFDATERAAIRLTVDMTRSVSVSDETFAAVRAALPDPRQVVELIGVIATYNMVSRFLVALQIEPEDHPPG